MKVNPVVAMNVAGHVKSMTARVFKFAFTTTTSHLIRRPNNFNVRVS